MPVARSTVKHVAKRATKRAASPARKSPKLLAPFPLPFPQPPTMAVPALNSGLTADATFAALKIPVQVSGKITTGGVVFLRGVLNVNPATGAVSAPATLFTLPPGMRPSCETYLVAPSRDQWSAPVVPLLLSLGTGGAVSLLSGGLGYDSMVWLDGISFML